MPDPLEALSKAKTIQQGTSPAGETVESILETLFGALGIPLPGEETSNQRFGAMLGTALPVTGSVRRMLAAKPLRVYHGSPHDFEKFDVSRIGTGEGPQAYGHGLYFAENPAVAAEYAPRGGMPGRQGIYEVNLHADPEQFLDWDVPLSQQGERVRHILETSRPEWSSRIGQQTTDPTAGKIVQALRREGDPEHVFRQGGIPGIRYLDQGSRATGKGTRNYVVFDDSIIEILKKYGLLPAAVVSESMIPEREGPVKRTLGLPQ